VLRHQASLITFFSAYTGLSFATNANDWFTTKFQLGLPDSEVKKIVCAILEVGVDTFNTINNMIHEWQFQRR